jgi:hypothetical protein
VNISFALLLYIMHGCVVAGAARLLAGTTNAGDSSTTDDMKSKDFN